MANDTAFGFIGSEHLWAEHITDRMIPTVSRMVEVSAAEYTKVQNALMDEFVEPVTDYQINYQLADGGELQPLEAHGIPRPTRPAGTYTSGFPIRGGGDAYGTDRVSRAEMTVGDLNRIVLNMMSKDARWMRRGVMSALLTNVAYTYTDPKHGAITVLSLANGDTVTYVTNNGASGTDDHFYAQAAVIATASDPFPTWYNELNEHPGNSGPYVAYVATAQKSSVIGLADFEPAGQAQILYGADITRAMMTVNGDMTGSNSGFSAIGNYLGFHNAGIHVVEWPTLPSGYGFVVARGGDKALGMRQYPQAQLQGFFPEPFDYDGNHMGIRFIRYAGFGTLNRVGVLSFRIGNASYAIPTGYDARTI